MAKKRRERTKIMKKKISLSLGLISLLTFLVVPDVYTGVNTGVYAWNLDTELIYDTITVNSSYLVTNGYWDVKGFQFNDPDISYPSGFGYTWQNGVVTIWIGDWEHDGPWQGISVGTVRQGSVWNLTTAPWYDQTTYQPTPLRFLGKSAVTLSARVRIDSQYRTSIGWINWLFNPWFRVVSTYGGITRVRKMVWDIVWGYNSFLGFSTASSFVDGDENLHLDFYVEEMVQTGKWKTYSIDLLAMAEQARVRAEGNFGWRFEVNDLYLWSIEANVEGWDYDTWFSVDFLRVTFTTLSSSPPNGSGSGVLSVSTWNVR